MSEITAVDQIETKDVVAVTAEPEPEIKAVKRKYVKRKKVEAVVTPETAEIKTEVEPIIIPEIVEVPENKIPENKTPENKNHEKVKINREEVQGSGVEQSFYKGGLIKPLLLGALASASFYVNNIYSTTKKRKKVQEAEEESEIKKKKFHQNFTKKRLLSRKATVVGFN